MGIVFALEKLYDDVVARFAAEGNGAAHTFGWRDPRQLTPEATKRVVWIPGDEGGAFGEVLPPKKPGRNPRPLANVAEYFTVLLEAADPTDPENERAQYRAARMLFDDWYRNVHHAAYGTFRVVVSHWDITKNERRRGAAIVAVCEVDSMVPDSPHDTASATDAEIDTGYSDGETETLHVSSDGGPAEPVTLVSAPLLGVVGSGDAEEGSTLLWLPATFTGAASVTYELLIDGQAVTTLDAFGSYDATANDVGSTLQVKATATGIDGPVSGTSNAIAVGFEEPEPRGFFEMEGAVVWSGFAIASPLPSNAHLARVDPRVSWLPDPDRPFWGHNEAQVLSDGALMHIADAVHRGSAPQQPNHSAYYRSGVTVQEFAAPFPGTVVNNRIASILTFDADPDAHILSVNLAGGAGSNVPFGCALFVRSPSGTKNIRFGLYQRDGSFDVDDFVATEEWQRIRTLKVTNEGDETVRIALVNGADGLPGDLHVAWFGALHGETARYAVPHANYNDATVQSCWSLHADYVPSVLRTNRQRWRFQPLPASNAASLGVNMNLFHTLLSWSPDGTSAMNARIELRYVAASGMARIVVWANNAQIITDTGETLTFDALDELTVDYDPSAGEMTLSGFTTGDGTYPHVGPADPGPWPDNSWLLVGRQALGTSRMAAIIHPPEAFVDGEWIIPIPQNLT